MSAVNIDIDSSKCKPKSAHEVELQKNVNQAVLEAIEKYNLPIHRIRWGRQVKSWGSNGVANTHVYEYHSEGINEFWINMHNVEQMAVKDIVWELMRRCFRLIKTEEEIDARANTVDLALYRIMHPDRGFKGDRNFKKLRAWLAARVFADEVVGLNRAFD